MSASLDPRLLYLIQPSQLPDGRISATYSIPDMTKEGVQSLLSAGTVVWENSQTAWEKLKDHSEAPLTREMLEDAISRGDSLWVREGPDESQRCSSSEGTCPVSRVYLLIRLEALMLRSNAKPVYFRMLDEDPGTCTHLEPSEPAEKAWNYPRVYSLRSTNAAKPWFGSIRDALRHKRGDVLQQHERTAKLRLLERTSKGVVYLGTAVFSHDASRCAEEFVDIGQSKNTRFVEKNIWTP
jgi:hypothetical protein